MPTVEQREDAPMNHEVPSSSVGAGGARVQR
jgi:hypothetical protein